MYQEYEWTNDPTIQENCQKFFKKAFIQDSYKLCKKSKLPKTKTVEFEREEESDDIDWHVPIFGQENPRDDLISAYVSTCHADSGAPQMFLTHKKYPNAIPVTEPKFLLYAIDSRFGGLYYSQRTKKYEKLPCGTYFYDTYQKAYVAHVAMCHRITDSHIFEWIKKIIDTH